MEKRTDAEVEFAIIGSGPAGLGAAYRLKELGKHDFIVLEQKDHVGGLATSFVDPQGFTWDIGGHVQFSHYDYFDQVMLKALGADGWLHHQRESWVWMRDRFIPYPFQNNIHRLPEADREDCLRGLVEQASRQGHTTPQNFEEWMLLQFGEGIKKIFMSPYNFKVWAHHPSLMNHIWIGERVSVINIERIRENIALGRDDVSWGPNRTFQFPKRGGTGAIWTSVAGMVGDKHFQFDRSVVAIDPKQKILTTSDGKSVRYGKILSTIPVNLLARQVVGLDPALVQAADGLSHSSTHIVGVGLAGRPKADLATKCWMYFPESNCPFYRTTVFSNYSPHNVPVGGQYYSLMTETSSSVHKAVNTKTLADEVIDGLVASKLISQVEKERAIRSVWTYSTEYGYPTPSLERDGILARVIPALDRMGIYSRGRFGGWKYEVSNQDHTFMQGVEWADFMVNKTPESTYKA